MQPDAPMPQRRGRPALAGNEEWVASVLEADLGTPRKQRHTARWIYDRLVAERGYAGSHSTVQRLVRELRLARAATGGARLLFQVFADAYKRQSVVITTNLEFSRWGVGVRGRPDGRRRDRPHRPPWEAHPVPWRVLPRPPCPHAGGLAAQKRAHFRCSGCPISDALFAQILLTKHNAHHGTHPQAARPLRNNRLVISAEVCE